MDVMPLRQQLYNIEQMPLIFSNKNFVLEFKGSVKLYFNKSNGQIAHTSHNLLLVISRVAVTQQIPNSVGMSDRVERNWQKGDLLKSKPQ